MSLARSTAPQNRTDRLWILFILACCLFVFCQVLAADFVLFDDDVNIVFNPHMGALEWPRIKWMFTTVHYARRYLPLGWMGLSAVYSFSKLNPLGYHVAGLAFHLGNAVLIFSIIKTMVSRMLQDEAPEANWSSACAAIGALFWALHPLRVQSVAWASGLLYQQAIFFGFASVACYLGLPSHGPKRTAGMVVATVLFAASLLTYPIGFGLAAVFFAIDRLPGGGAKPGSPLVREKIGIVAAALVVTFLAVYSQSIIHQVYRPLPSLSFATLWDKTTQAAYALVYFAARPLFPFRLSIAYTAMVDPVARAIWADIGGAIVALTALSLLVWKRLRNLCGPFLLVYALVCLPFLGLTEPEYHTSDRYAAFPSALLALLAARAMAKLRRTSRPLAGITAGIALSGLSWLSARQIKTWHDTDAFYEHAVSLLSPTDLISFQYGHRASYFEMSGRYSDALEVLGRGLRAAPGEKSLLGLQKDVREVQSGPVTYCPFAELHLMQALWLIKSEEWTEADEHLRCALDLSPNYAEAAIDRSWVLLHLGRYQEALHDHLWADIRTDMGAARRTGFLMACAEVAAKAGDMRCSKAALARIKSR